MKKQLLFILIVFIASITLFYIFDSIGKIANDCKLGKLSPQVCESFKGPTLTLMIILLFIAGFIFIILLATYIMILS